MAFRFRLESVLSLKTSQEEQVRNQLAILNARVAEARREVTKLLALKADLFRVMEDRRRPGSVDPEDIRFEALYLGRLNAETQSAQLVLQRRIAEARAKREELVGISRERRILEKLKEKHWERFRKEQDRREATLVSELYLSRFAREQAE